MNIFESDDYKEWVNLRVQALPNSGRGQYKRIAEHLDTQPTIVTQVFRGDRELTPEQAMLLAEYFGLSRIETKFLLLLVNYNRAGTHLYKKKLKEEIEELRSQAHEIRNRVQHDHLLNDEAKSILYSNWYYLAIWSLTAIQGFETLTAITERLDLDKRKAQEALEFLKKYALVVEDAEGNLKNGPTLVHLESTSSQIPRHHQNWRLQAFRHYEKTAPTNAHYTAPVTLSEKDAKLLRENILKFIASTVDVIKDSPSEKLYCLCVDWFEV